MKSPKLIEQEQGIRQLYQQLQKAVMHFNDWCTDRMVEAEVYQLPVINKAEIPDQIPVARETGEKALWLARRAFAQFERMEGQHPYTVYRLPGFVVVNGDPKPLVDAINQLKDYIREEVKVIAPVSSTRQLLCRRLFPGVAMLQLYRHIHCADQLTESLRFTWSPVTVSTETWDKVMAIEAIETWLNGDAVASNPNWYEAADIALAQLAQFPSSVSIIKRKPVAPHPRVSLFYGRGKGADKAMLHANVPVIVPAPCREQGFSVKPLKSFDRSQRRRIRRDKRTCRPLLVGMGLYY